MTNTESFTEILFEFSNKDRLNIIRKLSQDSYSVTHISKQLSMTTQEASRHMSRLRNLGLIEKNAKGFKVTPFGLLALNQLDGLRFATSHKIYFNDHLTSVLPRSFFNRLSELSESTMVDDVMVVLASMERVIQEADEYICRVTDRYNMMTLPSLEEATQRKVKFRLLQSKSFRYPPGWDGTGVILKEARLAGFFEVKRSNSTDVFLALSEKEVAIFALPKIVGDFDYLGFTSRDPSFLNWCKDLFEYYWSDSLLIK